MHAVRRPRAVPKRGRRHWDCTLHFVFAFGLVLVNSLAAAEPAWVKGCSQSAFLIPRY